jgi:hypothetical protein
MNMPAGRILIAATLLLLSFGTAVRGEGPYAEAGAAAPLQSLVEGILAAWDGADLVCLGEDHGSSSDSELRIALIRNPEFARRVDVIVGNSLTSHTSASSTG